VAVSVPNTASTDGSCLRSIVVASGKMNLSVAREKRVDTAAPKPRLAHQQIEA